MRLLCIARGFLQLLFATVSNQFVLNFACRKGLPVSLTDKKLSEIGQRKVPVRGIQNWIVHYREPET